MKQKLSQSQIGVFIMLAQKKADIQKKYQEIVDIENEQVEMVGKFYDFPSGQYYIRQVGDEFFIELDEEKDIEKDDGVNEEKKDK
jgi:hypothetical protein